MIVLVAEVIAVVRLESRELCIMVNVVLTDVIGCKRIDYTALTTSLFALPI